MRQSFCVSGMNCSACSAKVERSVGKLAGVKNVQVNLLTGRMAVDFDEKQLESGQIVQAVERAGYGARLSDEKPAQAARTGTPATPKRPVLARLLVSFGFLIPLMYVSMGHMMGLPLPPFLHGTENAMTAALTQFLLTLPILYVNRSYYQTGFRALFRLSPNMDSLIAIGSAAAVGYGVFALFEIGYGLGHGDLARAAQYSMDLYFESAGTILTLITLGKHLEARSKGKTGEAITKLLDLAPKTATVLRDGQELEIPVEQVAVGDLVAVRPGQSVPVDGVIVQGSASFDQSALTGESIPVEKGVGERVLAAALNQNGYVQFRAERVGEDTTLSQIIRLVEEAGSSKAPIAKLADKISGIFVPIVIGIALLSMIVWLCVGASFSFALSIGIAVLVISCPCALGLATPVAILVGTGKGAEHGILIKSAEALETAHSVQTVVLDKTGTITQGKPRVTDVLHSPHLTAQEFLALAASMEARSEHPLAEAVVACAREQGLALREVSAFQSVSGKGIFACVEGVDYWAGNLAFLKEQGFSAAGVRALAERLADEGKTPLYFGERGGALLGILAVADTIKPDSRAAIEALRSMKLEVVMLTGDNRRTAEAIARSLSLDRVVAEVLPQDKEREIRRLQEGGRRVAMVGDGINDAPALARADVGIAIGAGSDIAIESADVVLMKNSLLDVVTAIQLSRAVLRNIRENLFWAFFYNSVGIPLAAGVFFTLLGWKLNPMFGAAAMSLSSICVVGNALRLRFFRPRFPSQNLPDENAETALAQSLSVSELPTKNLITKGEKINMMTKKIHINGMSCGHCKSSVEKALGRLSGVDAVEVSLEEKCATVQLSANLEDDLLMDAVNEEGFEAVSVESV